MLLITKLVNKEKKYQTLEYTKVETEVNKLYTKSLGKTKAPKLDSALVLNPYEKIHVYKDNIWGKINWRGINEKYSQVPTTTLPGSYLNRAFHKAKIFMNSESRTLEELKN